MATEETTTTEEETTVEETTQETTTTASTETNTPPKQETAPGTKTKIPEIPGHTVLPNAAFGERVKLEAARMLKKTLGITLEEAKKLVADGGSILVKGTEPEMVQKAVTAAEARYTAQIEELRADNLKQKRRANTWKQKHRTETAQLRDNQVETELRLKASTAGTVDTDYALTLFARAVKAGKATDPDVFFTGLKATHPHLFKGATTETTTVVTPKVETPPVTVQATTAPPESRQPGETKPNPSNPTPGNGQVDVDKLAPHEFAQRTRSMYGFTPGA